MNNFKFCIWFFENLEVEGISGASNLFFRKHLCHSISSSILSSVLSIAIIVVSSYSWEEFTLGRQIKVKTFDDHNKQINILVQRSDENTVKQHSGFTHLETCHDPKQHYAVNTMTLNMFRW